MAIILQAGSFDAIIFDCDGTLVDTAPAHYRAIQQALQLVGRDMPAPWYFARVGLTPDALLDQYEEAFGLLPVSRPDLLRPYASAFQRSAEELREITVVADVARAWHGRVPMAVASNGQRENVAGSLRSAGLLSLFDFIVSAEDVSRGKPAPDVFLAAAERMQVTPPRCLVLEDTDEGLEAAHAAGMAAIDIRESWTPAWKQHS